MKKNSLILLSLLALAACSKEEPETVEPVADDSVQATEVSEAGLLSISGVKVVRLSDEMAARISSDLDEGKVMTKSMGLNSAVDELGVTGFRKVFPLTNEEFAERHKRWGLDNWYYVYFDESKPLTKAGLELESIDGIDLVEDMPAVASTAFNDPNLTYQWGMINDGSQGGGYKAGIDINVKDVWDNYTTGSSKVIVAVNDEAADLSHPDLSPNMLPARAGGSRNCYASSYTLSVSGDHGSHVAGIVGAVNNNGIGVAGVAGGNAADKVSGVKMMSLQIFALNSKNKEVSGGEPEAFTYAADNGAVISQNSWGYIADTNDDGVISPEELNVIKNATISASLKTAIDYFVANAGCDADGKQKADSPMKGGVVFFAAGNDGIQYGLPGSYEKVYAVGAISGSGSRASFSNYGSWVDICAPGVDILSCYANSKYGRMNGTSQACPHVSGVAALVLSYYGGPGFTNEMLMDKILKGANTTKVSSSAQVGPLVDALGAMTYGSDDVPAAVKSYSVAAQSNNLNYSWAVTSTPKGRKAYGFLLLASKDQNALKNVDLRNPGSDVSYALVETPSDVAAGETMTGTLSGLDFNADYYVSVAAYDYSHNFSSISELKQVKTLANNPPVITVDGSVNTTIHAFETIYVPFTVSDPDGHAVTVSMEGGSAAAELGQPVNGVYHIVITGAKAAGSFKVAITARDAYGAATTVSVPYTIQENQAPRKIKDFSDIISTKVGDKININGADYISDPDGETLIYTADISNRKVLHMNQDGGTLYFTTLAYGGATVTITATDALGATQTSSFRVLVRSSDKEVDAYPNPVSTVLNVRTGLEETETHVKLVSSTGSVVFDQTRTFSAFDPLQIDMKGCAPGTYNLTVKYGSVEYSQTIVKR